MSGVNKDSNKIEGPQHTWGSLINSRTFRLVSKRMNLYCAAWVSYSGRGGGAMPAEFWRPLGFIRENAGR